MPGEAAASAMMMRINGVARGASNSSLSLLSYCGRPDGESAARRARPASNLFNLGFWLSATGLDERAAI
jgi:hypothetical protein